VASLALKRATILKLALSMYELETGEVAKSLDQLVPKYLASIPLDPDDEKPFRYRVSKGDDCIYTEPYRDESIDESGGMGGPESGGPAGFGPPGGGAMMGGPGDEWGPMMPMLFPERPDRVIVPLRKDQGVLWCVGPDKTDDGGRWQFLSEQSRGMREDRIFLVPMPPK